MIRNYLKIAARNLMKYKFISSINLFGLAIGLTCCLLILSYILHELSYDRFHKNHKNIYRVGRTFTNPETGELNLKLGSIAPPAAPLLVNDFKEIKKITTLLPAGNTAFRYDEKKFNEQNAYMADEHLFDVFNVDVVQGNTSKALTDPFTVMLTEDIAKKYFGNEDPIDKIIRMDNQFNLKVSGIYKAFPSNSHIHPEMLISFSTLRDSSIYGEQQLRTNWGNNSFFTYMELPDNYDPKKLEAQFPAFLNRHITDGRDGKIKPSDWTSLQLINIADIHLHSHTDLEVEENGDMKRVYIFSAIALFILLIACINYMNLATARSVLRAKEIGVRKVVGAGKKELIAQFLCESILVAWIAILLGFAFTWLALPWLNELSGAGLSILILFKWQVIVPLLLVPFVVGIISGIYPAVFLSSFQPIKVLKGLMKVGGANISFRQVLVVTQFSISIILIISTIVVLQQLKFMQSKSLGFDKDHVVTIPYNSGLNTSYYAFKTQLLADPNIKLVGRSSRIPSGRLLDAMGSSINRGDSLTPSKADIKALRADKDFIATYGIRLAAGRTFRDDYGSDTSSFLINEAAVKALGLKSNDDAIGKQFEYGGRRGTLIGVVNDFHFESMHQRILPIVFYQALSQGGYGNISVKISGNNIPAVLNHIESAWKKFVPEIPYEYTFLEENFGRLYESEQRQGTIFTTFALIAILIACLGLFGLSAFAIEQRVKEIGIRKVLGANIGSIVGLISRDFLKLVVIAAVIAFPVGWLAMNKWLQDFAYRINIQWWVFLIAAIVATGVAFFTISFQAIMAAKANPVKNLRSE